jgi:hypothetical protein
VIGPLALWLALAQSSHVVIPFLASATKPADLAFEAGECNVSANGRVMNCEFQQVFLTTTEVVPDTCMVTTNRYARSFTKQAAGRWTSSFGPTGVCGVMETATLIDAGGVHWTMEIQRRATRRDAAPSCSADEPAETLSWQNIRRSLPCRFIQPGGLAR